MSILGKITKTKMEKVYYYFQSSNNKTFDLFSNRNCGDQKITGLLSSNKWKIMENVANLAIVDLMNMSFQKDKTDTFQANETGHMPLLTTTTKTPHIMESISVL